MVRFVTPCTFTSEDDMAVIRKSKGNPKGNPENFKRFGIEKPPPTHEQAVETGRLGGIASGISRRRMKEMDHAFFVAMGKATTGKLKEAMLKAGYSEEELNNATAIFSTLVAKAVEGDLKAAELLLDYARSVHEEERKSAESAARIKSLEASTNMNLSVTSTDDDDGGVVVYLPKIEEDDEEPDDAE